MTGGTYQASSTSTTEIYENGKKWKFVGELPFALEGLRGLNIGNVIYMFGKVNIDTKAKYHIHISFIVAGGETIVDGYNLAGKIEYHNDILVYNTEKEEWEKVGVMQSPRAYHAITKVPIANLYKYCI